MYVCECGGLSRRILPSSSPLFIEAGSLNQTQSSPMWLVSLGLLSCSGDHLSLSCKARIIGGQHPHLAFTWVPGMETPVLTPVRGVF